VKKRMVWLVMLALVCFACTALAAEERSISPKYEEMIVPLGKSLLTRYTVTPTSLSKAGVTFESSDAIKTSRHWLQTRVTFEKSKILENPNVDMYKAMVKFIYEIGKATLKAYNIFEE